MSHKHSVYDTDPHFSIDPVTRAIKNESGKVFITQHDHNSERFTFDIPKEVDGHNMSLCNRVRIHYINVDSSTKEFTKDIYDVSDLGVSPSDDNVVIFSWLLSGNATMYQGGLNFSIRFECVESNGTVTYSWGTAVHSGIFIGADIYNSEHIIQEYSDILAKWEAEIFGAGDSVMVDIAAAGEVQKDAIAAKAEAVLATIPGDYTATHLMADAALRTKAFAIVVEAEGETIILNDASDDYIRGLKLFGKTTQAGTPTLDAPVELVSAGRNGGIFVRMAGINLLPTTTLEFERDYYCSLGTTYKAGKYAFSAVVTSTDTDSDKCAVMFYKDSEWIDSIFISRSSNGERASYIKNVVSDFDTVRFYASSSYNLAANDVCTLVDMQLECGSIGTKYVPYSGSDLSVPHTLRGVPVASGGNYTDESGQQWIADYVDFERGVYVQNVDSYILDGRSKLVVKNDEKSGSYLYYYKQDNEIKRVGGYCTHFVHVDAYPEKVAGTFNLTKSHVVLMTGIGIVSGDNATTTDASEFNDWLHAQHEAGTPVTIAYVLATPIETPLTEEELYAFSLLHSNYPTTTVLNDSGAHMVVRYNADTKAYIDNKIAELIASIAGNL